MRFKNETFLFWAAAAICLAVASYGFWGGRFTALPLDTLEEIASGEEMDDPAPPQRSTLSLRNENGPGLAEREWGTNPFLTASEETRFGPEHRFVGAGPARVAAGGEPTLPEARALIRSGGRSTVLLGGGTARMGQEAGGVRVVGVDGRRVLVEGANGRQWIEVVPSNRDIKVNGADR